MKAIRAFVIGLVGLATLAGCAWLGAEIAMGISDKHDIALLVPFIEGGMIGLLVGMVAAFPVAKFFADNIWIAENKTGESPTSEIQQQLVKELESNNPDLERQRVERYGQKIVICPFCATKNSMSFSRCIKCSKDIGKEQPVDNPYL